MAFTRGANFNEVELDIVGGNTYGRYPKISIAQTYNMFQSDSALVPYAGYEVAIKSSLLGSGIKGRAIFTSTKLNKLVVVEDAGVYLVDITYNTVTDSFNIGSITKIGTLATQSGVVYIEENNKPQIGISDGVNFYIYDPSLAPSATFINVTATYAGFNFIPGYLTFHQGYFILASSQDRDPSEGPFGVPEAPNANNLWRLSNINDGTIWSDSAKFVGALNTKPDNTQAVVRVPSKGNMIYVMGKICTEAWFHIGGNLFPYSKNNQLSLDYGCLSPATVASLDETVCWLAINESSGPVILASDGSGVNKITTDGIDYLFSTLRKPEDSQGFLYRQDGHLFYHINFYTDNISLYYDFSTKQFYNASDQHGDYFIASQVAFFKNQYYFVTKNNGNLYAFDTEFTTYGELDSQGNPVKHIIPRSRTCSNIRQPSQDYFIVNDLGFTIESGQTNYNQQALIPSGNTGYGQLSWPRVDLSISIDGGATFGQEWGQALPPIGHRKNKLMWWQLGAANDMVVQLKFWSIGRIVIFNGIVNVRM